MLWNAIKKSLGVFDYALLVAAVYMFTHMDYANLNIVEIVYIVSFTLWIIMLGIRININYRGRSDRKLK